MTIDEFREKANLYGNTINPWIKETNGTYYFARFISAINNKITVFINRYSNEFWTITVFEMKEHSVKFLVNDKRIYGYSGALRILKELKIG